MKVVTVKFGRVPPGKGGIKLDFLWGLGFSVISRNVFSSVWVALN